MFYGISILVGYLMPNPVLNLFVCIQLTIILLIIIMSRHQYESPWPSPATPLYRSSLPVDLQGYILYWLRAIECRSLLDVLLCSSMWGGLQEYATYEFISTSPSVSCMSGSSNLDSFRDECLVAVQSLLCGVLPPGLVQYCSQHSCVVAIKLFQK